MRVSIILLLTLWTVLVSSEVYDEELVVSRLPDASVLSQFRFVVQTESKDLGNRMELFPRIIAELIKSHSVEELHFSLGQGRWFADRWGLPPQFATPTGGQVTAWINANSTVVDQRWKSLINSLNGVFCTSLNSITAHQTSSPELVVPIGQPHKDSLKRHGAIAKENVCTENLTPWKNLFPCKQTGLITLINPLKLYGSLYHNMYMTLVPLCENSKCFYRLELGLSMVTDVDLRSGSLDWDVVSLFGRKMHGYCKAASTSRILVQMDRPSQSLDPMPSITGKMGSYSVYELKPEMMKPSFSMGSYYSDSQDALQGSHVFSIFTHFGGIEQASGLLRTVITNNGRQRTVRFGQVVPWYVEIRYHTLHLTCKQQDSKQPVSFKIHEKRFVPAIARGRPATMEWKFDIPEVSICEMKAEINKAFLRLREYPPDANHGLYAPAAMLTTEDGQDLQHYRSAPGGDTWTASQEIFNKTTFNGHMKIYGNVLLVVLPVPDFSMPFNVICLVVTAFTLGIGPLQKASAAMMVPINSTSAPSRINSRLYRWMGNALILLLLLFALHAQYYEISWTDIRRFVENEFRRSIVEPFKKLNEM